MVDRKGPGLPASGHQPSTIHYQPKLAARVGLAPTPRGLTGRRAALTLPGSFKCRMQNSECSECSGFCTLHSALYISKVALPAGVAPASIRLEDECLVYFDHGSVPELD